MLILKRKGGESFTINGQIKLKILNKYGTVKIGIEAPTHIRIIKDEEDADKELLVVSDK